MKWFALVFAVMFSCTGYGDAQCDVNQHQEDGCTENTRTVSCVASTVDHGTNIKSDVDILWSSEKWSDADLCDFNCNEGYYKDGDKCVENSLCQGIKENDKCRCEEGMWWELDFSKNPTTKNANSDQTNEWILRDKSTFETSDLQNGVWKTHETLDTTPNFDFNQSTSIHLKFRNVSVGGKGAVFWINADSTKTQSATLYASLALQKDGTQTFGLFGKTNDETKELVSFPNLSNDFIDLWLSLDVEQNKIAVWIESRFMGQYDYPIKNSSNENRFASILGWGSEAEFDFIRIESCADGAKHPPMIKCENTQHAENGVCASNTKTVECSDATPENGKKVESDEEVNWEGGSWNLAPPCDFLCDVGYQKNGDVCVLEGGTKLVMATEDDITGFPHRRSEAPPMDWKGNGGAARQLGDHETLIIENLIFDGNSPKGGFLYIRGNKNIKTNHVIIRNCAFLNSTRTAVTTYQVGNVTLEGNYFDNVNVAYGVWATYNSITIRKNKFSRTGQELGFLAYQAPRNKMRNTVGGISRYFGSSFVFEDNLFDNSMDMRFYKNDGTRKDLTRHQISDITYMDDNVNFLGLKPSEGTKAIIRNNIVVGNEVGNRGHYGCGLIVDAGCQDVVFENNIVLNAAGIAYGFANSRNIVFKNNIGHATSLGSKYITMRHTKYGQNSSFGSGEEKGYYWSNITGSYASHYAVDEPVRNIKFINHQLSGYDNEGNQKFIGSLRAKTNADLRTFSFNGNSRFPSLLTGTKKYIREALTSSFTDDDVYQKVFGINYSPITRPTNDWSRSYLFEKHGSGAGYFRESQVRHLLRK